MIKGKDYVLGFQQIFLTMAESGFQQIFLTVAESLDVLYQVARNYLE
jgi:hypothetical protein